MNTEAKLDLAELILSGIGFVLIAINAGWLIALGVYLVLTGYAARQESRRLRFARLSRIQKETQR